MLKISVCEDKDNFKEFNLIPGEYRCELSIKSQNCEKFFKEDGEIEFRYKIYSFLLTIIGKNIPPDLLFLNHDKSLSIELDCPVYQAASISADYKDVGFNEGKSREFHAYDHQKSQYENKSYNEKYYKFDRMYTVNFKFVADEDYKWEWQLLQEIKKSNNEVEE